MKTTPAQVCSGRSASAGWLIFSGVAVIGWLLAPAKAIDANGNGLNDVWELIHGASALAAAADADSDGATNAQESAAGTYPFDPNSHPTLGIATWTPAQIQLGYPRIAGKRYRIESKTDLSLAAWTTEFTEVSPSANAVSYLFGKPPGAKFWRLRIDDFDSDGDGLLDAEERWLKFDPATNRTDRNDTTDLSRRAGRRVVEVSNVWEHEREIRCAHLGHPPGPAQNAPHRGRDAHAPPPQRSILNGPPGRASVRTPSRMTGTPLTITSENPSA